jgi:putative flippase GtrA
MSKKKYIAFKYLFVWTGSILLNTAGTFALTELSGQYFIFAKIVVAVGVALLWNYQLQRLFVYRDTHIVEKIKRKRKNKHKRKK